MSRDWTIADGSHLLARLGKAERIGNLVGQFEFTGMPVDMR
jgi:hypothetical protein